METKNDIQAVKTRKKKLLKKRISRKKLNYKQGGNIVNSQNVNEVSAVKMARINMQSIKSFFQPLQLYFKSPIAIIYTSKNIRNAYLNNLNSDKAIYTVSKYILSNDNDNKDNSEKKRELLKLLNESIDTEKVKDFGLNLPLDNTNAHILINIIYLSIKNIITKVNRYTRSIKCNIIRLSKEKKSTQQQLYKTNKNNIFKYLSEQQRQELILMIKEKMKNCINNYYNVYNLLQFFFKDNKIPLRGKFIDSNNYKKQIFEICKQNVSRIKLKTGVFQIPVQNFEDYNINMIMITEIMEQT